MDKLELTDSESVRKSKKTAKAVLEELERIFRESGGRTGYVTRLQLPHDLWYDGHEVPKDAEVFFYSNTSAHGKRVQRVWADVTLSATKVAIPKLQVREKTVKLAWTALPKVSGSPRRILRP